MVERNLPLSPALPTLTGSRRLQAFPGDLGTRTLLVPKRSLARTETLGHARPQEAAGGPRRRASLDQLCVARSRARRDS